MPNMARITTHVPKVLQAAVSEVKIDHHASESGTILRCPKNSTSVPEGIWKRAYDRKNTV
jgi:hypothetical protein